MVHVLFGIDRRAFALLLLLSAIVAAARFYTAPEPLERDLTTYALVAHEVLEGKPFYTGIWDNKPPGIHSVYALAELAFGYGPKAIAWLNTLTSLAVLWALFSLRVGAGTGKPAAGLRLSGPFSRGPWRLRRTNPTRSCSSTCCSSSALAWWRS